MTSDPYLPPGCTQRMIDEAHGYLDEPPQRWCVCEACDGEGVRGYRITVYEAGCGFPHDDTWEEPCPDCGGAGGWLDDAEADDDSGLTDGYP